jgi:hypothetical protein
MGTENQSQGRIRPLFNNLDQYMLGSASFATPHAREEETNHAKPS